MKDQKHQVRGIGKRYLITSLAFLMLFLFMNLVSAELGIKDSSKPKLEAPEPSAIVIEINDSTLNVNNSDYLDGYDSSAYAKLATDNNFIGNNYFIGDGLSRNLYIGNVTRGIQILSSDTSKLQTINFRNGSGILKGSFGYNGPNDEMKLNSIIRFQIETPLGNFTNNVSAKYYFGDARYLTNVPTYNSSYYLASNPAGYLTYGDTISYADNANYAGYCSYTSNYGMSLAGNDGSNYVMDDNGNYLITSYSDSSGSSNYATSAGDADTVDGYHATSLLSTYNLTYNNLINKQCPAGQVVNGTNSTGGFTCLTSSGDNSTWNETRANTLYANKPTGGINGSFAFNSSGQIKYTPYSFYNETNGVTTFSATSGSLTPGQTVLDVKGKIRMGYTAGTAENSAIQLLHGWGGMNRTSNQLMRFDGTINTGGVATTETYRIMQFEMGSISIPVGNTGGQANVYEASSWLTGIPAGATFGTINWFRSSPYFVSAGNIGTSNGFLSGPILYSSGNITTLNGVSIQNPSYTSSGKVLYNHGINVGEQTSGYNRNIGYLYGTAPSSGNYSIYSGSTQNSYFDGNITSSKTITSPFISSSNTIYGYDVNASHNIYNDGTIYTTDYRAASATPSFWLDETGCPFGICLGTRVVFDNHDLQFQSRTGNGTYGSYLGTPIKFNMRSPDATLACDYVGRCEFGGDGTYTGVLTLNSSRSYAPQLAFINSTLATTRYAGGLERKDDDLIYTQNDLNRTNIMMLRNVSAFTCDSQNKGETGYNYINNNIYYCNSSDWVRVIIDPLFIGNTTANVTIDNVNGLRLGGTATTYNDVVAPLTIAHVGATAPQFSETEMAYYFEDGVNEEYAFTALQLPHSYKPSSNIYCHLHVRPATTEKNNVTFELNYSWYNLWETSTTTRGAITVSQNFTSGVALNNTIIDFGGITGTGKRESSTLAVKITRKSNSASDTYTGNVYVDFLDCHHEMEKLGTNNEYT